MKLWLVENEDWDYDCFTSAVVWADSPEEAEQLIRAELRFAGGELWISDPSWRLTVAPAATEGVPLVHWHAG